MLRGFSAREIRQGLAYSALDEVARTLALTQDVLLRVLGISERTLQRRRRNGQLSSAESDRLWRFVHIYQVALPAFENQQADAVAWLTTPNDRLGGDTPVAHLDTEPGMRLVEQMLTSIHFLTPS
ncbi:MAG: antitoxin Xre-like helix-turn-helix domain-containing protein [Pseudomonadota bacterium]